VIIEEDISILNSKKEKLDNVEYGENVHVYGILENDSNYAVVGWNDLFGLIEIKALDKIEINYSVNDFKYSKEEYDAEVVDFPLAFRNNKGYLVGEVPIGTIVHVYGIWEKDEERAVISWEGMIGTVIVRRLKKVIVNETLDNFEYTKNEYDAQVVNYDLAFRDNNNNLIEEIPIGEKVHVYGIYKKNPERAVISWKNQYGTVLVKHLYSIINSKAENFMYSGTSYWAVVFSHDFLYLWDANDKYFADVPANSLIWVYGEYDKDLKQPRTVINWNGKIGTVRSEFLIKIDDAVHVDIKKQKVTMFENGEPLYYGDCVTGREEGENPTPTRVGQFKILEMNEDDVPLKGEDYEVFVDYWMGFDGGIGLHDSTRTAFGGNIYLKNGSHGCVNLPKWLAEKIYRRAYVDMSVHVSR